MALGGGPPGDSMTPRRRPAHPEEPEHGPCPNVRLRPSLGRCPRPGVPMTEEEIRRRNEEAIRAFDSLDEIGDEDEQRATLAALMIAIDEEPLSDRKRFR